MKIPKSHQLETERFALRIPKKEELPLVFEASRVEGFNEGMGWDPPANIEELDAPFDRAILAWEEQRAYQFSIIDKASGQFVGRISIRKTKKDHVWNVGFWTLPKQQGKGTMTETLKAVMTFGFDVLQALRIEAEYAYWNTASKKVLERNGMRFIEENPEGLFKKGEWVKEYLMAIDRSDWQKNSPPTL